MNRLNTIVLKVTSRCNEECEFCYVKERNLAEMSIEEYKTLLFDFAKLGGQVALISGGEPLLRTDVFNIIKMLSSLGIYSRMATNGKLLSEKIFLELQNSGLCDLQLSILDMTDKHVIKRVSSIINVLSKFKCKTNIGVNVIISKSFIHKAKENFYYLINRLKVDRIDLIHPKFADNYNWYLKNNLNLSDYLKINSVIDSLDYDKIFLSCGNKTHMSLCNGSLNNKIVDVDCSYLSSKILYVVISSDGKVYPCSYTMHDSFILGDLKFKRLSNIVDKLAIKKNKKKSLNLPCIAIT